MVFIFQFVHNSIFPSVLPKYVMLNSSLTENSPFAFMSVHVSLAVVNHGVLQQKTSMNLEPLGIYFIDQPKLLLL